MWESGTGVAATGPKLVRPAACGIGTRSRGCGCWAAAGGTASQADWSCCGSRGDYRCLVRKSFRVPQLGPMRSNGLHWGHMRPLPLRVHARKVREVLAATVL